MTTWNYAAAGKMTEVADVWDACGGTAGGEVVWQW